MSCTENAETSSLFERVRYWAIGWEMAKRHPLTGVGVAGYPAEYTTYRRFYLENPSFARLQRVDTSRDEFGSGAQAHNEYVQILAELGFPGLALFLTLAALVVWQLWVRRKDPASYLTWGAAAGLAAFAVSSGVSSFSFRQAPTAAVAVCLLSLGLNRSGKGEREQEGASAVIRLPKAVVAVALCLALALGAISTWYVYRVIQGDRLQAQIEGNYSLNDMSRNEAWVEDYRRIFSYDPYNRGAHFGCGLLLFRLKRPQEAAQHIEEANRLGYRRPFTDVLLAFAYEQSWQLERAVRLLEDTLRSFPDSPLARIAYIEYLRQQGRGDDMRREQEILKRQNPALAQAQPALMRKNLFAAVEEARRQNQPSPYDALPDGLEKGLLQLRAYHYIQ